MVPKPRTGGGGTARTKASWMPLNFWFNAAAMAGPLPWAERRSSNGFKATKTMPALGATLKPLMLRPGKATADSTPGVLKAMSDILRITASVRSREAASGSCAKATRYCLSWVGAKPVGTLLKPQTVSSRSPPYTTNAMALLRNTPATAAEYSCPDQVKTRLKGRKNQPNSRSMPEASQSFLASCGLSNTAHRAGERVSELKAEITVEIAMVMANCL